MSDKPSSREEIESVFGPAMITVKYSCKGCKLDRRNVRVQARHDGEDVRDFMLRVRVTLTGDHERVSPNCKATEMSKILIPVGGNDRVGGQTIH